MFIRGGNGKPPTTNFQRLVCGQRFFAYERIFVNAPDDFAGQANIDELTRWRAHQRPAIPPYPQRLVVGRWLDQVGPVGRRDSAPILQFDKSCKRGIDLLDWSREPG